LVRVDNGHGTPTGLLFSNISRPLDQIYFTAEPRINHRLRYGKKPWVRGHNISAKMTSGRPEEIQLDWLSKKRNVISVSYRDMHKTSE